MFSALIFTVFLSLAAHGQPATPQLLKEPSGWTFERFALPPVFAPDFPYKGAEELRFSPGMFNKMKPIILLRLSWHSLTATQLFHRMISGITCLIILKACAAAQPETINL